MAQGIIRAIETLHYQKKKKKKTLIKNLNIADIFEVKKMLK